MPQAARTTDPISPHSPCAPGQCGPGSQNVITQNKPAYRVGDDTLPHGIPQGTPPTCVPHVTKLVKGSTNVHINNQPAGRVGDTHACGVVIVAGADKVIINGSGGSIPAPVVVSLPITMTVPDDLLSFIKSKERFTPTAYWDVKQYTNGYGTKANSSTETITREVAEDRLGTDATKRRRFVVAYAKNNGYTWNNNQINALTSFVFNLGTGKLSQLTDNASRTNDVIAEKIKLYVYADGVVENGLVTRRNEESAWFTRGE
jgi:GH24 family phage-related lysozyme (muramidase)/uncharacterized Zn-binding protein involved in type VI secretion